MADHEQSCEAIQLENNVSVGMTTTHDKSYKVMENNERPFEEYRL